MSDLGLYLCGGSNNFFAVILTFKVANFLGKQIFLSPKWCFTDNIYIYIYICTYTYIFVYICVFVYFCSVNIDEDPYAMCEITIVGNAFLWHQIRCIVSVLFMVGEGKEPPEVSIYPKGMFINCRLLIYIFFILLCYLCPTDCGYFAWCN